MNFRTEKDLKILNELVSYCYHFNTKDIQVNIKNIDNTSYIEIQALIPDFPEKALEKLVTSLNTPRQREVEQYYWQIGGEYEFDSELTLVGMMTDKVTVTYNNHILDMKLERKSIL
ncbi:MAG: hypothetical protein ACRC28_10615 [Clostridium sp.]|uniref:hypothetical protein n=1 Tax=Clostridium sp. TaxID=1506 RepID=UPI003F39A6F3